MASISVELSDEMVLFLDGMVASGAYVDRGDALRGLVRDAIPVAPPTTAPVEAVTDKHDWNDLNRNDLAAASRKPREGDFE